MEEYNTKIKNICNTLNKYKYKYITFNNVLIHLHGIMYTICNVIFLIIK